MKISVSEEDPSGQTQETMETTVKFAGNVGFDVNWGTDVKTGLKFGASAKKQIELILHEPYKPAMMNWAMCG